MPLAVTLLEFAIEPKPDSASVRAAVDNGAARVAVGAGEGNRAAADRAGDGRCARRSRRNAAGIADDAVPGQLLAIGIEGAARCR